MVRHEERGPRLEPYSHGFAQRLFARHPEWREYERRVLEGPEDDLSCYLHVEVPSENPAVDVPLHVYTSRLREVTVAWMDGWHMHIAPWPGQANEEHYDEALRRIDAVVLEEVVIGLGYKDVRLVSSVNIPTGTDVPARWADTRDRIVLRSWRGTYDRTIEA